MNRISHGFLVLVIDDDDDDDDDDDEIEGSNSSQ